MTLSAFRDRRPSQTTENSRKAADAMITGEGFILGLSNGAACLATCAPVFVPYLLGEGKSVLGNAWLTGQFLFGRLAGYLLFAVPAWFAGRLLVAGSASWDLAIGASDAAFAVLLVHYGFFDAGGSCKNRCPGGIRSRLVNAGPASLPIVAGLVTGLSFCPPLLLAFTGAAGQGSLGGSLLYFLSFFAGTSLLFLPAAFVGFFRGFGALRLVGRMAAGLAGLYFLYSGVILLIGGFKKL